MGEQNVEELRSNELRSFTRAILDDLQALEFMLDSTDLVESGVRRVGAEQEMFIVYPSGSPAPKVTEFIDRLDPKYFTTELARFNLEANMTPREFTGSCLSLIEEEVNQAVRQATAEAQRIGADIFLTGILPTLSLGDLGLDAMTPLPRYHALNDAISRLKGGAFKTMIKGLDELQASHDNILLEACNTSFQIHFQVSPEEFAPLYNLAQAVTAPVLAPAVNSPTLLQHRLWRETRIALFQQSIDMRTTAHQARGDRTRVNFGDRWVKDSIIEIFREDIARFRVMLSTDVDEDPIAMAEAGKPPKLAALRLHNGTVYRWNRPCYGVVGNLAHLRIENRVLPAGPTVVDEVANAAFYFGLMSAIPQEYGRIEDVLDFDVVKGNFTSAARHGLRAQFGWVGDREYNASDLILDHLLPLAREGLASKGIDSSDSDKYLGILEERVRSGRTGAQWMLGSLAKMNGDGTRDERFRALVVGGMARQKANNPVHTWDHAQVDESNDWRHSYQKVSQFMVRDLFTVRADDIVDLAASLMEWEHIRHVPVEDDQGCIIGSVTYRELLRMVARRMNGTEGPIAVRDIMVTDLRTVTPDTPTLEALRKMRDDKIGCLPVVSDTGELVGIISDRDLLKVAAMLMEKQLEGT